LNRRTCPRPEVVESRRVFWWLDWAENVSVRRHPGPIIIVWRVKALHGAELRRDPESHRAKAGTLCLCWLLRSPARRLTVWPIRRPTVSALCDSQASIVAGLFVHGLPAGPDHPSGDLRFRLTSCPNPISPGFPSQGDLAGGLFIEPCWPRSLGTRCMRCVVSS